MNQVIPNDSRYIPLTQQKWCCVPTCIQIVMLRQSIPLVPSELIGHYMGLVVPDDARKYFWEARTGTKPPAGFGTQVSNPKYNPNAVFRNLKIPLKMNWSLINKFKNKNEFKEYLRDIYNSNKDVLVCFDWPSLFDPQSEGRWGHVCVLDKVDLIKDEVRIIDPEYDAPKWRVVDIKDLYHAMKFHGKDKSGGFWELTLTR